MARTHRFVEDTPSPRVRRLLRLGTATVEENVRAVLAAEHTPDTSMARALRQSVAS